MFEFTGTESEVSGGDFVTEGFPHLSDTERHSHTGGALYVCEIHEDTLCRFGTKVHRVCRIFRYTLEGFKHQIKFTNGREIGVSANRTNDFMFGDERFQGVVIHCLNLDVQALFLYVVFYEVIRSVASFTGLAVHKRIGESAEVSGRFPRACIHQNSTIYPRVVGIFLYEFLPPSFLDVIFQLYAQRTVVPRVCESAVDFATGENESSVFAKGNEFFHRNRSLFSHSIYLLILKSFF